MNEERKSEATPARERWAEGHTFASVQFEGASKTTDRLVPNALLAGNVQMGPNRLSART